LAFSSSCRSKKSRRLILTGVDSSNLSMSHSV
jgi:hypothetical protein